MALVALPGWFDDSERDDDVQNVAALGGCVGTDAQWQIQDAAWNCDVLRAFDLEYMHMREVMSGQGKFAQFKDKERSRQLAEAIIGTFRKSAMRPFGAATRLADLCRFNKERARDLSAYALNIYACMSLVRQSFPKDVWEGAHAILNLDRRQGTTQAVDTARQYAKTNPHLSDLYEKVLPLPLARNGLAKTTPALQAADFVAWEMRRDVELHRDFWDTRPLGETNQALRAAHAEWLMAQYKDNPFFRRSMRVFVRQTPILIWRWTYNLLCLMDDGRAGIWISGDAKKMLPSTSDSRPS